MHTLLETLHGKKAEIKIWVNGLGQEKGWISDLSDDVVTITKGGTTGSLMIAISQIIAVKNLSSRS